MFDGFSVLGLKHVAFLVPLEEIVEANSSNLKALTIPIASIYTSRGYFKKHVPISIAWCD